MKGVNLQWAHLDGAHLKGADLKGADLERAFLAGVDLNDVNLKGANLKRATLYEADLKGANLQGANLKEIRLNRIDEMEKSLGFIRGALTSQRHEKEQQKDILSTIKCDDLTSLPEDYYCNEGFIKKLVGRIRTIADSSPSRSASVLRRY